VSPILSNARWVDEKGRQRKRKNPLEVFPSEHPALS
jgi:hypothetical protein